MCKLCDLQQFTWFAFSCIGTVTVGQSEKANQAKATANVCLLWPWDPPSTHTCEEDQRWTGCQTFIVPKVWYNYNLMSTEPIVIVWYKLCANLTASEVDVCVMEGSWQRHCAPLPSQTLSFNGSRWVTQRREGLQMIPKIRRLVLTGFLLC